MKTKNVAILGGSFNPIHLGHLWVAKQASEIRMIDKVYIMPCYSSDKWKKKLLNPYKRYIMCHRAINDLDFNLVLCEHEIHLKFKYTYQIINWLCKEYPKNFKFFWIIGSDWNVRKFKNYNQLKEKCSFLNMARPSYRHDIFTSEQNIRFYLSSSEIRKRIKKGLSIKGLTTVSVERYIQDHNLYK